MTAKSISDPNLLQMFDEDTHEICYGCNQKWYPVWWQRLAGCGPTVATNLIFYLYHARGASEISQNTMTKKYGLQLMEEIWGYVTPKAHGVSTTKMFYEGVLTYAKSKGLDINYGFLDLPKDKSRRPGLPVVLSFLEEALSKDAPIAFLNLCNGAEKRLEEWHWVTIIALEYIEDGNQVFVDILDDGQIIKIDLTLWYHTTGREGGFVYITSARRINIFLKPGS